MGRIYSKYLELKAINAEKLYLFKSGKFYIFVGKDCDTINNYIVLKKVKFCNESQKCGFPEQVLDDYLRVFKNHNLNIEIITDFTLNQANGLYDYIESIDINKTTPIQALEHLIRIKEIVQNEKKC